MKKIFILMIATLLISCAPRWLYEMKDVHNNINTGIVLFNKGDYSGAIQELTRAIDNIPVVDNRYKRYKKMYPGEEELDADSSAKWDAMISDGILYVRSLRSNSYLLLHNYGEAMKDANWVIDYYLKNKCTRGDKDTKDICEKSVERAVYVRGNVYHMKNNYKQAIQDYDWIVENGKKFSWKAYEIRGRAYLRLNDYKTACTHFDTLIKKYPTSAKYYALRCSANYELFKCIKFDKSTKGKKKRMESLYKIVGDCNKSLEIDPKNKLAKETRLYIFDETLEDILEDIQ